MAHIAESGLRRATDLSAGSGMHFTDPLPRKWPDNNGRRVRCACGQYALCLAHAAQRDAATRVTPTEPKCWRSECRNGCYYGPEACSVTRVTPPAGTDSR